MAPNPVAAWFNKNHPREYADSPEGDINGRASWFMLRRIEFLEAELRREREARRIVDSTFNDLMREFEEYKKSAGMRTEIGAMLSSAPPQPGEPDDDPWPVLVGDETEALLREAYTRLMVSEGDARYIANNVALAERIAAVLPGEAG